jgi:hypothetical protein
MKSITREAGRGRIGRSSGAQEGEGKGRERHVCLVHGELIARKSGGQEGGDVRGSDEGDEIYGRVSV